MIGKDEIVLYQPNNSTQLEIRVENETVWLTQAQMVILFERDKSVISRHIKNIFEDRELEANSVVAKYATTAMDGKMYSVDYYNLDVIISVGYRVKSPKGILFRQWATRILRNYLLKGYAINQRFEQIEQRVSATEKKIEFFVKTSLPPKEGIFFDGQIFDAYVFVSNLIKSAKKSVTLIDNYVDESILLLLSKRKKEVSATIYTQNFSPQLELDLKKHNAQYPSIVIQSFNRSHDRFLFVDNITYHVGASLKDLGKKLFAFSKMEIKTNELLNKL